MNACGLRCLVLWLCMMQLALAATVKDVRVWPEPDKTRIVLDLSGPIEFDSFMLNKPERFVLDLKNTSMHMQASPDWQDTPITNMRYASRNQHDTRLVFDLSQKVKPQLFKLNPNSQYGYRLVLDFEHSARQVQSSQAIPYRTARPTQSTFVVAIDAGHGGEDPGAIGPRKTKEKDVVLAIAKELAAMINKEPGMRAVLIREGDYYIGLRQRIIKARQHQADLFVSIHADAFKSPTAKGASVFTLSPKGATSEAARWLADKENRADLIGGVSLDDKDDVLTSVLLDLSQTVSQEASISVGQAVLNNLGGITSLHGSRVQQAGFAVLKSPDIPSILVETEFISNPDSEKKLRSKSYQREVSQAVLDGIKYYLRTNSHQYQGLPVLHTAQKTHTVRKGETLSELAARYQTSISVLRKNNALKSDELLVGQVLHIP